MERRESFSPLLYGAEWKWQAREIVHGQCPFLPCESRTPEGCLLCLQHAFPRSLPVFLRQRYVRHDHDYSEQPKPGQAVDSILDIAISSVIEKSYLDTYEELASQAAPKSQTHIIPNGSLGAVDPTNVPDVSDLDRVPVVIEDMETLHRSVFSCCHEVELNSTEDDRSEEVFFPDMVEPLVSEDKDSPYSETLPMHPNVIDKPQEELLPIIVDSRFRAQFKQQVEIVVHPTFSLPLIHQLQFSGPVYPVKSSCPQPSEFARTRSVQPYRSVLSKCRICGIVFNSFKIIGGRLTRKLEFHCESLRFHEAMHANMLNCVYPTCRHLHFGSKSSLESHMDCHRQVLMVGGTENWENFGETPLYPPFHREHAPHLTCEICQVDFNWRVKTFRDLSHVDRFKEHRMRHLAVVRACGNLWCCVLEDCNVAFGDQYQLVEHVWLEHALSRFCGLCQWVVWGDIAEVNAHRVHCRNSRLIERRAKPSLMGGVITRRMESQAQERAKDSGCVIPDSNQRLGSRKALFKTSAATAAHLMNFSFYCDHCGAPFRRHHEKQYRAHQMEHLPDRKLTCLLQGCGQRFGTNEELHAHVKRKLSTCRHCGGVFEEAYKRHTLLCRLQATGKRRMPDEEQRHGEAVPKQLFWENQTLKESTECSSGRELSGEEAKELFMIKLNLVKGRACEISAKSKRLQELKGQRVVANRKGQRACTLRSTCRKCGRIFRTNVILREHMRTYHNEGGL